MVRPGFTGPSTLLFVQFRVILRASAWDRETLTIAVVDRVRLMWPAETVSLDSGFQAPHEPSFSICEFEPQR